MFCVCLPASEFRAYCVNMNSKTNIPRLLTFSKTLLDLFNIKNSNKPTNHYQSPINHSWISSIDMLRVAITRSLQTFQIPVIKRFLIKPLNKMVILFPAVFVFDLSIEVLRDDLDGI